MMSITRTYNAAEEWEQVKGLGTIVIDVIFEGRRLLVDRFSDLRSVGSEGCSVHSGSEV
jgi:hypothetical protein